MKAILCALILMLHISTASECGDQCPDGFTLWSAVSTDDVCKNAAGQVCGICSSTETKCSDTTSAPTESPGSDGSGSTGSGGFGMSAIAAGVATCNQFQNAGTKGVLYTDKPDGSIPCANELKITTEDEKKAMHEAVNPTVELWVFSDTDAASTALYTELRNMNYYTVTDLGGRDLKVKDCGCVSAAVIDVESADYSNQVAGAVVCAIIAVMLSCALCYCLGNNKEMYPVEGLPIPEHDEKADDVEEATARDVKADAGVDRKIFDSQWTPEETLDDQLEDKFTTGGNEHTAI